MGTSALHARVGLSRREPTPGASLMIVVLPLPPRKNDRLKRRSMKHGGRGLMLTDRARAYPQLVFAKMLQQRETGKAFPVFDGTKPLDVQMWWYSAEKDHMVDVDGYVSAILDALQGTMYPKDAAIDVLHVYRCGPDPKHGPHAIVSVSIVGADVPPPYHLQF